MELTQNLWERFGFSDNPYDTRALSFSERALLPITKAFIGREMDSTESRILTNFFRNPGGGRVVVEGDVGVGKTTFVNYHRFLWEYEAQERLLTPTSEISVYSTWTANAFVMSILGSLVGRFLVLKGKDWVHSHDLLSEIAALTHVYIERSLRWNGSVSVLGTGVGGGRSVDRSASVPDVGMPQLISYLERIATIAHEEDFFGITLHFDNMELLLQTDPDGLGVFFDEIRDALQTPQFYFVFVASQGFFQTVIAPRERVRSIFFGQPIVVPPLSEDEVLAVLQRRYELLATEPEHWIPPVGNELVVHLYSLFDGKIRFVMDAIQNIVSYVPESLPGTISDDMAMEILIALANERVAQVLTPTEREVLAVAAGVEEFSNAQLTELTSKRKQNIATYIEKYVQLGLVRRIRQEGSEVLYEVAADVRPLAVVEAQGHDE